MAAAGRRVPLGRIVGLHGVQGWVKLESWTEPRTQIFNYRPWLLGKASDAMVVDGVSGHPQGKGLVAHVPGVDDRDAAAKLVGCDICVEREQLPAAGKGEFYWVDLEGLEVVTMQGVVLGQVSHLFATGANDVVVVRNSTRERLIPFIQGSYVQSVDVAGNRMVVDWDPEF